MTTTALTSELEAINTILQAADEAPVSSTALSGLYPLDMALSILSEVSRAVQTKGWTFNTEEGYPLARDGNGYITLPGDILSFDVDNSFTAASIVLRGQRLYDRKAHTYVIPFDVTGTARVLLGWDSLPQAARHYITIRAAKVMQGRTAVSDSTYKYTQADLDEAMQALTDTEAAEGDYNMLRDSWSVGSVLFDREMR